MSVLLQQMCGKGVAQQVRINPFRDARLLCGGFQPFRHDAFRKGFARPALEEPHFRLIQTVVFRQLLHQRPRQQRVAVFLALALPHPYQVAGLVDVAGLQFQQFADAQAGGVEMENMQKKRRSFAATSSIRLISSLLSTSGRVFSRLARFTL